MKPELKNSIFSYDYGKTLFLYFHGIRCFLVIRLLQFLLVSSLHQEVTNIIYYHLCTTGLSTRVTRLQKLYENILSNRGSGNNNEQVYDGCLSQVALNFCDIFSKKKYNTAALFYVLHDFYIAIFETYLSHCF